jgi:hypothetical protein
MRITFARTSSTALGLSLAAFAAYVAFSAGGCTVTTSDDTLDGGDTGVANTDTGQPPNDTGSPDTTPTDTGSGTAVVIKAQFLVGGLCDSVACDIRDFGGGSKKSDIIPTDVAEGMLIYDAFGSVTTSTGSTVTSTEISGTATTTYSDGRITGLQAGTEVTITVTGYLRGKMGDGPSAGTTLIPWATATCKATPSATTDVQATCTRNTSAGAVACTNGCLTLIPTLKGILFTNDVLPSDYCTGKGATDFSLFRARLPFTGTATVSRNEQDCSGVIWVPADGSWSEESPGVSNWGLSLEPSAASEPACSLSNPCKVDRNKTPGACATAGSADCLDVYVVGSECQMTNASTGGTCF